jgi:hypothetical protein
MSEPRLKKLIPFHKEMVGEKASKESAYKAAEQGVYVTLRIGRQIFVNVPQTMAKLGISSVPMLDAAE